MFKVGDLVKLKKQHSLEDTLPFLKNKSYKVTYETYLGDEQLVELEGLSGLIFCSNIFRHAWQLEYKAGDIVTIRNIPYNITLVAGEFIQYSTTLFVQLPKEIYSYVGFVEVPLKDVSILDA